MDLESVLTLDARDYTRAADKAARANEDLDESATQASRGLNKAGDSGTEAANDLERTERTSEDTSDSLFELDAAATAAAGGMIGAGVAAQQALDSTKQWRTNLNQTATTANLTDEEVRELAASITDASLRMGEASQTLNLLAGRGVDTEDDLKELTQQFNAVAEATGTKLPEATRTSIQVLRAFGKEAEDIEEEADNLVTVSRRTGLEFREVGDAVADIQPFVDELGLTLEDTAAILLALEEQGLNAQRSQELLARAAEESDGSMKNLRNRLELTTQDLNEQRQVLRRNSGAVVRLSQDHRDALSPVDRLRSSLDDSKVAAAGATAAFEFLPPILTAAGGASLLLANTQLTLGGAFGLSAAGAASLAGSLVLLGALAVGLITNFANLRDRVFATISLIDIGFKSMLAGLEFATQKAFEAIGNTIIDRVNRIILFLDKQILRINKVADDIPGVDELDPIRPVERIDFEEPELPDREDLREELQTGLIQASDEALEGDVGSVEDPLGQFSGDLVDAAFPDTGTSAEELFGEGGGFAGAPSQEDVEERIREQRQRLEEQDQSVEELLSGTGADGGTGADTGGAGGALTGRSPSDLSNDELINAIRGGTVAGTGTGTGTDTGTDTTDTTRTFEFDAEVKVDTDDEALDKAIKDTAEVVVEMREQERIEEEEREGLR